MLKLHIKETELFDEENERFIHVKPQTITLEHSLLSISKWESKWHKPFLGKGEKTQEEQVDYVRCMTITPNVPPEAYYALGEEEYQKLKEYIEDPHTATTVHRRNKNQRRNETVTAEVIYSWMIQLEIPWEFEKRNLNWLLMLIEVCDIKNGGGGGKRSKKEVLAQYRAINEANKAKYHTTG